MKSVETQKAVQTKNEENASLIIAEQSYESPVPHPNLLKGYYEISPDFPDRILKMAEANNKANIELAKDSLSEKKSFNRRGQILTFIIVVMGFGLAAAFEFVKDATGAAITSLICGVTPLGIAGINQLVAKKK